MNVPTIGARPSSRGRRRARAGGSGRSASANASSVRRCAIAARSANGTWRSHGARAARVEEVPGVEDEREQDDREPRQAGAHVARRPRTAPHRRSRRRSSRPPRSARSRHASAASPNTNPNPPRDTAMPETVEERAAGGPRAASGSRPRSVAAHAGRAAASAQERLARRSRRRRRRRRASRSRSRPRGGGQHSPAVGHFQTHQRSLASSGVVSASSVSARPSRPATSVAIGWLARPRSRSCTGSSGRRSRSRAPPLSTRGRRRRRCERGCHRLAEDTTRDRRPDRRARSRRPHQHGRQAGAPGVRRRGQGAPRGRPAVHELDRVLVAQARRRTRPPASAGGPWRASAVRDALVTRLRRPDTRTGGAKSAVRLHRNQRGAATAVAHVEPRRPPAPTRAGRGSAAGRRRPSTRPRPTAAARRHGTASRAAACAASACRGSRTLGCAGSRLKNDAPVLVVDARLRDPRRRTRSPRSSTRSG